MNRIDLDTLTGMMRDPEVDDAELARFLVVDDAHSGPLTPRLIPNPELVELPPMTAAQHENAMSFGNAAARWRRQRRLERALAANDDRPLLVSEGDSWFQFPFLIRDVIDHLGRDHLVMSLDAAGDTADNMLAADRAEISTALTTCHPRPVRAFLFSGAGNDVIGTDPLGASMLDRLVRQHDEGRDAAWHIDHDRLELVMAGLERHYTAMVAMVRAAPACGRLPILIHGYDHALPGGFLGDRRRPIYIGQSHWLGRPMRAKGIDDPILQRGIIRQLIDELYAMLHRVAATSSGVHVVDVRGAIGPEEWADEIHGDDAGFANVADRFRAVLATL